MMRQPNYQNQRGFTLVEMLAVVVILALLIGMALPSLAKMRRIAKVNSAANRVYTGLARARNLALRKQKPIIVKVRITASNLEFLACIDADYASIPGANNVNFSCDGNPVPVGTPGDSELSQQESPFGLTRVLVINIGGNRTENDVFLGFPALDSTSTYTPQSSNLGAPGLYWFGFDSSGKLIPDGRSPFTAAANVSGLTRYPAGAAINTGGPEFYFAEYNAVQNNTRAKQHVYRKVELLMQGSVRVQQWQSQSPANCPLAPTTGCWIGLR